MLKKILIEVKGLSPILMHRFPMEPVEAIEKKTPEEQAEIFAFRDSETKSLYIPGLSMQRAFVSGATYLKGKGRSSLVKQAAACLTVTPDYLDLKTKNYEISAMSVVNPSTKGRIIRYRPMIREWKVMLELEYDDVLLSEKQIKELVDITGSRVGILDFRPEKKGFYGKFTVVRFEEKE